MINLKETIPIKSQVDIQNSQLNEAVNHKAFIVFVRTKQFLKTRLKGIDEKEAVHIPQKEIAERFFPFPKWDCKNELQKLVEAGQLKITETKNTKTGHNIFFYETLLPGKVDLYLIKPKPIDFDPDTLQMIEYLKQVTVDQDAPVLPPYFESFLTSRHDCMNLFFTVDDFSGRVHSPVTSLKGIIREHLLIDGTPTIGIDVATMQPLLLGKALKQVIGTNEYSKWIDSGEDIYIMLQQKANLETRDQGKKRFFEILFAPADNKLATMFGDAAWITWINKYKSQLEPRNPHNAFKPYSNVAWLLQSTEVSVMRKVWHGLINAGIPFLSVHDEIIVKQSDQLIAENIFTSVLDQEFTFFKLNIKGGIEVAKTPPIVTCIPNPHIPDHIPINEISESVKQYYLSEVNKAPTAPFNDQPASWSNEIKSLESFFNSIQLFHTPIRLDQCSVIHNLPKFISGHMAVLHTYNGNPVFLPYLKRLQLLQQILQSTP